MALAETTAAIKLALDIGVPIGNLIMDYVKNSDLELTDEQLDELSNISDVLLEEIEDLIEGMDD